MKRARILTGAAWNGSGWALVAGALLGLVLAVAACGVAATAVQGGGPTAVAARPAVAGACTPDQLAADQVPLAEGTGDYYVAWSLTNVSSTACTVAPGRPELAFDNAGGDPVVSYQVTSLADGSISPVNLGSGRAVWFLTDEAGADCGSGTTATGGPFHYEVTLPGGTAVTWAPAYLAAPTLGDLCAKVPISVGGIQATRPAAP